MVQFLKNKVIRYFGCAGSSLLQGLFSPCSEQAWAHCGSFSCGARASGTWAQPLWRTGLVARQHVESSWTRDRTRIPCIGRWILNPWTTRKALVVRFYLNSLLSPWLAFLLQGWLHYALTVVSSLHNLLPPLPSSPVLLPSLFTSSTRSYSRTFAHALPQVSTQLTLSFLHMPRHRKASLITPLPPSRSVPLILYLPSESFSSPDILQCNLFILLSLPPPIRCIAYCDLLYKFLENHCSRL